MTTKQILDEMEKEFDERFPCLMHFRPNKKSWGYSEVSDEVKSFIHSYTRKLIESLAEEYEQIIGRYYQEEPKGKYQIIIPVEELPNIRLKVKEIINSLEK